MINEEKGAIQSVGRALRILGLFDAEHKRLTYSEICQLSKIPPGSVFRFLSTMKDFGFLDFEPVSKRYSLGPRMIFLGSLAMESIDLVEIARPYMEELKEKTNETVSLFVRRGFKKVCVFKVESEHSIRYSSRLGEIMYLHGGASGKVLMSGMTKQELDDYEEKEGFNKLTPSTLSSRDEIEEAFESTREEGYAISFGERSANSAGIGVPIFDCKRNVIACLNITLPADRFDKSKLPEWVSLLKESGMAISRKNGLSPGK